MNRLLATTCLLLAPAVAADDPPLCPRRLERVTVRLADGGAVPHATFVPVRDGTCRVLEISDELVEGVPLRTAPSVSSDWYRFERTGDRLTLTLLRPDDVFSKVDPLWALLGEVTRALREEPELRATVDLGPAAAGEACRRRVEVARAYLVEKRRLAPARVEVRPTCSADAGP